jgi:imidazole glycerol-phosphate synthase subunit HisH
MAEGLNGMTHDQVTPVAIVDYGFGNLASVQHALEAVGAAADVVSDPAALPRYGRIVLPGVGAFGDGMRLLRERGWVEALHQEVQVEKKPFLGLCLGMQLLATTGLEHGETNGLGWIPGTTVSLRDLAPDVRLPHVGWNDATVVNGSLLFRDVGPSDDFYFVHSYVFVPTDERWVTARCEYGASFAAALEKENVFATQFHPEKSQRAGMKILENFSRVHP